MFVELISLLIIFWLPPTIVIISSLIWDLKFWQSSDYERSRFYHHLEWDFSPSHRRFYRTIIKIILFAVLSSALINVFPLEVLLLAVLLTYSLWSAEALEILENTVKKKNPIVSITPRNLSILSIVILVSTIIPVYIGIDIFTAQGITLGSGVSNYAIGFIEIGGIQIIPSLYLYLVFSSLVALAYDLGSPIFLTFGVYVTSPVARLYKIYWIWRAKQLLERQKNLLIVAVSGSYGKTTTKNLISHILSENFKTIKTPVTETSELSVAKFIVDSVKLDTQAVIIDTNAYKKGDVAAIGKLIRPHIAIITGIDENHIGLFGSIEETLMVKAEILSSIRSGGTAVMNIDDDLVSQLVLPNNTKEILYSFNPSPKEIDSKQNKLEVDHYIIRTISDGNQTRLDLKRNESELIFTIPFGDIGEQFSHSITAAVITATELGIQADDISQSVQTFKEYMPEISILEGDSNTHLLIGTKTDNIKQFEYLLSVLEDKPEGTRILATSGIKGLGNHKLKIYAKYRKQILSAADVIISYDKNLINLLRDENPDAIVHVSHPDDMLYQIRARMEPGDTVALHGDLDRHIIETLRNRD